MKGKDRTDLAVPWWLKIIAVIADDMVRCNRGFPSDFRLTRQDRAGAGGYC